MRHQEGTFKGIRNASIYYQCWLPEGESTAVLLIVHGLAEHSGRYMNVVNHFVPLGYAVYGVDHVGHGKSSGTRVYVERFEDYTDTLKIYFDMVRHWQPEKPVFLVGHSMGGLIGAVYLLDYQAELTGAVLSGPAVKVHDTVSSAFIFVGKLISVLMPKLGLIGLEAEGVSRDPAVVQAYVNDPLVCRGKVTARLSAELVKAIRRLAAEATKITLPILILQGSADRLVDPKGAQMLYDAVNSVDKTIKIYDGLYHEVYNEPEHGQVLGDVKAWLETHLSRRT
ncbi:MAG: lysophospholipase [Thermodesulfobacteriota bacterium]